MIEGVKVKKLQKHEDERGWLSELFRDDEMELKPVMSYISWTNSGHIRGPHEHESQSDFFVFPGPGKFTLYLWDRRKSSSTYGTHMDIGVGEDNPVSVIVPPGVVHGYKCISDYPALCINLPDKLYKGAGKKEEVDEIRWEEKKDSPYKI